MSNDTRVQISRRAHELLEIEAQLKDYDTEITQLGVQIQALQEYRAVLGEKSRALEKSVKRYLRSV